MPRRRNIEVFNLSFLDCLCCGFGAILLLFLLSIGSGTSAGVSPKPQDVDKLREQLASIESRLLQQTEKLASAANPMKRDQLISAIKDLEAAITRTEADRDQIEAALNRDQIERAEAERLLESFHYEDLQPIGLPVDATHIVFVIDTSGSMRHPATQQLHETVLAEIRNLLAQLPATRAIQFIDSSGNYMLPRQKGYWLPDTPGLRSNAVRTLRTYPVLSVSDPAPGITRAFRDLSKGLDPEASMAIYMLGDDFRGSTQAFLGKLDSFNPRVGPNGQRTVSINAVGFPTIANPYRLGNPQGNVRFANIMREVVKEHGGVLILKPRI